MVQNQLDCDPAVDYEEDNARNPYRKEGVFSQKLELIGEMEPETL